MKLFSLINLLLLSATAFGQIMQLQDNAHFSDKAQGYMTSLPPAPPGQAGSFFVHEEFNRADIYLKDSTKLANVSVRIDAKDNVIEIQHENQIKILPLSKVIALTVTTPNGVTEKFINGDLYKAQGNIYNGRFLQIHHEGNVSLLSRIQPIVKKASTTGNPMTNVGGQKDDELILKTLYLIVTKDAIIEASQSKAKFREEVITVFGDDVEALVKQTNNKNLDELTALVTELNNRSKPK
jgi:hypothetical protein